MSIEKKYCLKNSAGEDIYLFTLRNASNIEVCISNYGAIITSYKINGLNIALGFEDIRDYFSQDYLAVYPYFGCIVGRYANRIKNASFYMGSDFFLVSKNMGEDQLHGGLEGFDKKVWEIVPSANAINAVTFKYISKDGEEGFPGNLTVTISFELNEENELIIVTRATTDKTTAINLTHHDYFNLNEFGTIDKHLLKINAGYYLGQDANLVTDGNLVSVAGTSLDFRNFRAVDALWNPDDGYDQTFVIDKKENELSLCAECIGDITKLRLQVFTTEPSVHFYTGRWIPFIERNNKKYFGPYSGLCFETQKHPNSINIPHFPDTILRPGEEYYEKTIYKISAAEVK